MPPTRAPQPASCSPRPDYRERRLDRRAPTPGPPRRAPLTPLQARWVARGRAGDLLVGPYVLLGRLGQGGMGQVFLARHRRLGRLVALKVVRTGLGGGRPERARFYREAQAAARLNHPHVAHAYDAGEERGSCWLALEYIRGPDLGRLVRRAGPLDPARACRYAGDAALGLQHVHEAGLVHRDVKPANLALDRAGRVRVLDVGLASGALFGRDPGLTQDGVLVGTADYAAPEQVEDPRAAGPAANQYALGATLYFLLTGAVPFPGGPPARRALRRLSEDPVPLEAVRPGLPATVAAVVHRLMARRPEDRFGSGAEAAAALRNVVTDAVACPAPPSPRPPAEPADRTRFGGENTLAGHPAAAA